MGRFGDKFGAARGGMWTGAAVAALTLALAACGGDDEQVPPIIASPSPEPTPTPPPPPPPPYCDPTIPGSEPAAPSASGTPITHETQGGWRIEIMDGALVVRTPVTEWTEDFHYATRGNCEMLGTQALGVWDGDRRTILLPDGAKLTMRAQERALLRVSLYDGDISREIDVLTDTVTHDSTSAAIARSRDEAEYDGKAANLTATQFAYEHREGGTGPWIQTRRTSGMDLIDSYREGQTTGGAPAPRVWAHAFRGKQTVVPEHYNASYDPTVPPQTITRFAMPVPAVPAQADAVCDASGQPRGGLSRNADGTLTYLSRTGQWRVRIDTHTVTVSYVSEYDMTVEMWGDPHENLNGKHIKDWETSRRTLLLSDGTKITMHADGPHEVIHTTSIYDGAQSHEIGNVGSEVRHSCVNAATAASREAQEADGETALLGMLRSIGSRIGGLSFLNIYTETEAAGGGAFTRQEGVTWLGETGEGDINPNQINDYYDDPRIGHT